MEINPAESRIELLMVECERRLSSLMFIIWLGKSSDSHCLWLELEYDLSLCVEYYNITHQWWMITHYWNDVFLPRKGPDRWPLHWQWWSCSGGKLLWRWLNSRLKAIIRSCEYFSMSFKLMLLRAALHLRTKMCIQILLSHVLIAAYDCMMDPPMASWHHGMSVASEKLYWAKNGYAKPEFHSSIRESCWAKKTQKKGNTKRHFYWENTYRIAVGGGKPGIWWKDHSAQRSPNRLHHISWSHLL